MHALPCAMEYIPVHAFMRAGDARQIQYNVAITLASSLTAWRYAETEKSGSLDIFDLSCMRAVFQSAILIPNRALSRNENFVSYEPFSGDLGPVSGKLYHAIR